MQHTVPITPAIFDAISDAVCGAVLVRDLVPQIEDDLRLEEVDGDGPTGGVVIATVVHVQGPVDLAHAGLAGDDVALVHFELVQIRVRPRLRRMTLDFDKPLVTV